MTMELRQVAPEAPVRHEAPRASAIIPRTLDDVARMAKMAHESGLAKVSSPAAAGVILLTGAELGLSPMQSLRGIYVVDGKPVLSADLMVAVVRRSGLCASWETIESTAEACTIETLRVGDARPVRRTWTMDDAQRAGLGTKGTWRSYPRTMLRHRCATDLAREMYPDVILGLYDPEELGGDPALDAFARAEVVKVTTVAAPPTAEEPTPPLTPARGPSATDVARLGVEHPQSHARREAPAEEPAVDPEREATEAESRHHDTVGDDAAECFAADLRGIELPGEAVSVWMKHRAELAPLTAPEREACWKALCERVEKVGQMKNAKVWLKKAIAEEDARRAAEGSDHAAA